MVIKVDIISSEKNPRSLNRLKTTLKNDGSFKEAIGEPGKQDST